VSERARESEKKRESDGGGRGAGTRSKIKNKGMREAAEFDRLWKDWWCATVESCGYVCASAKTCLLRGTRKAATNLISPASKYLDGGKRRSTMVDIFPTFFSESRRPLVRRERSGDFL